MADTSDMPDTVQSSVDSFRYYPHLPAPTCDRCGRPVRVIDDPECASCAWRSRVEIYLAVTLILCCAAFIAASAALR